ncbi:MAG TPA: response regulator [Planctomycetota bacterium]
MTAPRLLLVEDDPNDVLFFQRALGKLKPGTVVVVARDGEEAMSYLKDATHVVLDLKLPRKSGLEVLECIRACADFRDLRVSVLTSSKDPIDLERVHRAGVDRYSVKPATFSSLLDTLREILDDWRLLP